MVYCAKDMLHFIVLHDFLFDGLNWNFVVKISLHFLSLHCIWWLCTGWWGGKVYTLSIVLLLISFDYTLHTVHCIVLHCIALYCIALQGWDEEGNSFGTRVLAAPCCGWSFNAHFLVCVCVDLIIFVHFICLLHT